MREAAAREDYEEAARLRDRWQALSRALERNPVAFDDGTDADLIGLFEDQLQLAVQVFHVRGGRIRGEGGLGLEKCEELSVGGCLERARQRMYAEGEVITPAGEVLT